MLKKNKWKIVISSIVILLPMLLGILLWKDLPDVLTTHWGADGHADGFSEKAFAVFGLPCILLILHFVCLLITLLDKKQQAQNQKVLGMLFWIVPYISFLVNGIVYRAAFGKEIDLTLVIPLLLGALLVFMGNYLPKVTQNSTFGIKLFWTLHNEENWNKTHRFGGKVWVGCGFALLACTFLPLQAFMLAVPCLTALAILLPFLYSYLIYRQHKKQGIVYTGRPVGKAEKTAARISAVIIPILLLGIAVFMFTGNIEVDCGETSFQIHADYYADIEVAYSEIDTIAYRKDFDTGIRTSGLGSARLAMGIFQNEEFGSYTLYAYTGAEEFAVVTSGDRTLVIGMDTPQATQALYDTLAKKLQNS